MKLRKIKGSSNILKVGYDAKAQRLTVEFKGGGRYDYADVPADVFTEFNEAESKGSYLHEHIRSNYEATKHEDKRA